MTARHAYRPPWQEWIRAQHVRLMTRKCADPATCPCPPDEFWHDGRLTWYGRWHYVTRWKVRKAVADWWDRAWRPEEDDPDTEATDA